MIKLGAAFWIHRTSWAPLRDAAIAAERAGFDSLWVNDHLLCGEGSWKDAQLDGWSTISSLAAVTDRATVGVLVAGNTFRNPGLTAKQVTTLDHISCGRAVLGIGGGWFAREHEAFGIDFGDSVAERLDRLDESVMLIRSLLDGDTVDHEGRFYAMTDAVVAPPPVQSHLPILVGGSGLKKTLRTAAKYADAVNIPGGTLEELVRCDSALRQHCATFGRDPETIERTFSREGIVRDDAGEAKEEFDRALEMHGLTEKQVLFAGCGSPAMIAEQLRPFIKAGFRHPIWIFRPPYDLETIYRLGEIRAFLD